MNFIIGNVPFLSGCFQDYFSLTLVFTLLIVMYFIFDSLGVTLLRITSAFCINRFMSFSKSMNSAAVISPDIVLAPFSLFVLATTLTDECQIFVMVPQRRSSFFPLH